MGGCASRSPVRHFEPDRALAVLRELAETRSYSAGDPTRITITPDETAVLFLRSGPRDRTQNLYVFETLTGQTRLLASAETLLGGAEEVLSQEEKSRRERQRVRAHGVTSYTISEDGELVLIPMSGAVHVLEMATRKAHKLEKVSNATDARFSPDGRFVSFVRDHDVHICEWRTGETRAITTGGTEEVSHGQAEFVAQEEMDRYTGYWWSPDSAAIAFQETDNRGVETLYIADPSAPASKPQSSPYPRAGKNNAKVRLGIISITGGEPVWVHWKQTEYPYLATVRWSRNAPLAILVQNREQQDEVLLSVDHVTGLTTPLLRERDDTWLNLQQSMPMWLESGSGFLWMSESDGEWRLSLHEPDGKLVRVLNPGSEFRLRSVLHVDEARGLVFVSGSPVATERHIYELPLKGGEAAARNLSSGGRGLLTAVWGKGHHITVTRYEDLKGRSDYLVTRVDGQVLGALPSEAAAPSFVPRVELTRVGPNNEFDAAVVRPRDFQSGRKYPVIVSVYGGPSDGVVNAGISTYFKQQWYADQGYIVVSSDNRGVRNRGRVWERAIYGSFADVPLDDQITALRALGERIPEMDMSRVGIMGWSFGGYMSALAVTKHWEVFKAAAAGAPVVDWLDYDTHYTERYLNTPQNNPEGYRRSSILHYANDLQSALLLIHGTADDNVYFGNSLKLADQLFRAGKSFEFIPIARCTHGPSDADTSCAVDQQIAAFFRRILMS